MQTSSRREELLVLPCIDEGAPPAEFMDKKDSGKDKYQARRTKGRVEVDGPSENAFEDEEQLEERWESTGFSLPKWVLALVVGGLIGVIVAAVIAYRTSANPPAVRKEIALEQAVIEEPSFIERSSSKEIQEAVEETVSGFMNASSNVERCRYVLGGERLQETMDEFYSRYGSASQPQGFGRIQTSEPAVFGGETIMIVLAIDKSGKRGWTYSLFSDDEGMRIDWESSVSYGEFSWPKFLREKPKTKVQMRVYLRRLPTYRATRKLPNEADAFEVTAYRESLTEVLYVAKESAVGEALEKIIPERVKHPVNLYLSWNDQGELQADELIHNLWAPSDHKKNE